MEQRDDPRLRQILDEAAELPPAGREEFLSKACGGDAGLRAEVESLLAALSQADQFLRDPTVGRNGPSIGKPSGQSGNPVHAMRISRRVGPYKLLQKIGEGWMGIVFMAEQEQPVKRKVALKIIKIGMDTKQVIARFEAERQALAMMEHPNIARILDAGATQTGRPYFVMELVRGPRITSYCDKNALTTRQRLELFIQVCRAVQHAHQKGIIHRDIKPSNVLVTLHDGVPVPKIIDFGIAKATGKSLTEKTLFTEYQQFLGTPEYMSPEQAEMSGLDIDTRADIYALGVLLYELLTGATPIEGKSLRQAAYAEMHRIIRDVEPPSPSTRISQLDAESAAQLAALRQIDPGKLQRQVRGELDWIVMKCLEKDRSRRYESASDVAGDLARHLNDEPVTACPPSRLYRVKKLYRRYRRPLLVTAAVAIVLIGMGIFSYMRVSGERDRADRAAQKEQVAAEEARADQRQAELSLVEAQTAQAGAEDAAGQVVDARHLYLNAWQDAEQLGISTEAIELGMLDAEGRHPSPIAVIDDPNYANVRANAGDLMASSKPNSTMIVCWDAMTGRKLGQFTAHSDRLHAMKISPDVKFAVSAYGNGTVAVWAFPGGRPLREIKAGDDPVNSVDISPDGSKIITAGETDHLVRMFDVGSGHCIWTIKAPVQQAAKLCFSADGKRILYGGGGVRDQDYAIRVMDLNGSAIGQMPTGGSAITNLAVSAAGSLMGFVTWNRLSLADERTLSPLGDFLSTGVNSHAFSADGKSVLAAIATGDLCLLDVNHLSIPARTLRGHQESLSGCGYLAADGICRSNSTTRCCIWNVAERSAIPKLPNNENSERPLGPSGDSAIMATLSNINTGAARLHTWDTATGHLLQDVALPFPSNGAWDGQFIDDRRIAMYCPAGVAIWDVYAGKLTAVLHQADGLTPWDGPMAASRDGHRIAVSERDGTVLAWDDQGNLIGTLPPAQKMILCMDFMADNRRLVICDVGRTRVWDTSAGKVLKQIPNRAFHVSTGDEGNAVIWQNGEAVEWNLDNGKSGQAYQGAANGVSIAVSPDRKHIVVSDGQGAIYLWDTGNPKPECVFHYPVSSADAYRHKIWFRQDGAFFSVDGTSVYLWDVNRPRLERDLGAAAEQARAALRDDGGDTDALLALMRWYEFRGVWGWAVLLAQQARAAGTDVSDLNLARDLWQLGDNRGAAQEFAIALERNEAPADYLRFCITAAGGPTATRP